MSLFDLSAWRASHPPSGNLSDHLFAVLDFETTGVMPEQSDRVVEAAVVHLDGSLAVTHEWSSLVNPDRDLSTEYHNISGAMVKDAPPFKEIADDLVRLLAGRVLVAHNASFERRFLMAEFGRLGLELPPIASIDTLALADRQPLAEACKQAGIELIGAHTALGDTRATADLLRSLIQTKFGGAATLRDVGCKVSPAAIEDWPDLPYELTEHRRSDVVTVEPSAIEIEIVIGMAVCFTGEARLLFEGQDLSRSLATEIAESVGLVVKRNVSKKVAALVAADIDSLSGKAKQARERGIPIVSYRQFWELVGVEAVPLPQIGDGRGRSR